LEEAAVRFQPYGPFRVPLNEELKAYLLAKQFDMKKEHLNEASGVYIFISGGLPVYVGQAQKRSFGARISDHFNRPHNRELKNIFEDTKGQVSLLLIALAKDNGDDLRIAETNKAAHCSAIHKLEESLIGTCLAVNPRLLNVSSVRFYRDTHVPGYLNTVPQDKIDFAAANALAKLLRQKRTNS
jgi:hypothetical protein